MYWNTYGNYYGRTIHVFILREFIALIIAVKIKIGPQFVRPNFVLVRQNLIFYFSASLHTFFFGKR
jgi:hypothetical protein